MKKIALLLLLLSSCVSLYAQKVGIGKNNFTPTEALHLQHFDSPGVPSALPSNFRFHGALMPNNLPGAVGQVLQSQGPNLPPVWGTAAGGSVNLKGLRNYAARWTDISGDSLRWGLIQDDSVQVLITGDGATFLPMTPANALMFVKASNTGAGVLNNQRLALKATSVDSTAIVGEKTTGLGAALIARSFNLDPTAFAIGGQFEGGKDATGAAGNVMTQAVRGFSSSLSTNLVAGGAFGSLSSAGIYGAQLEAGMGHGVQGITFSTETTASGVWGLCLSQNALQAGTFGECIEPNGATAGAIGVAYDLDDNQPNDEAVGNGMLGEALCGGDLTAGVWGLAANEGDPNRAVCKTYGVQGSTVNAKDSTAGVYGEAGSEGTPVGVAFGVIGASWGASGGSAGVMGTNDLSDQVYGVLGRSQLGTGVYGTHTDVAGIESGVMGVTESSDQSASAVHGLARSASGATIGVLGETASQADSAVGVLGWAYETTGSGATIGVMGLSDSQGQRASGVLGKVTNADATCAGVRGKDETDNATGVAFAGWFDGKVNFGSDLYVTNNFNIFPAGAGSVTVNGDLGSTGLKTFLIDHPLEPAGKYLYHACVESNEVLNMYSGNVVTDAQGMATINLPDYFETLNTDFRYGLTCVRQFAQAIVLKPVAGNRFTIQTDKPNVQVSWMVQARRNDPTIRRRNFTDVLVKEPENVGRYLDPAAYGQPAESRIGLSPRGAGQVSQPMPYVRATDRTWQHRTPTEYHNGAAQQKLDQHRVALEQFKRTRQVKSNANLSPEELRRMLTRTSAQ